ncbi:MAG: type II toxin-antitoxin system RelE/ParE family toxin [Rhodospirillales bacterium]|nr:type II toxin-antitoxin system RelE/ParE family toxin [Rhodospirillales bacterium]
MLNTPSTELGNALLEAHVRLDDLRVPPANRPEALRGDRPARISVRVNEQWRICFV